MKTRSLRSFSFAMFASVFAGFADLGWTRDPSHAAGTCACGFAVVSVVFAFLVLDDGRGRAR